MPDAVHEKLADSERETTSSDTEVLAKCLAILFASLFSSYSL